MSNFWNEKAKSARQNQGFVGTCHDLELMVGEPPRSDAYLFRIDANRPISKNNFKWGIPATNQKRDLQSSTLEGKEAPAGTKCPYHESELLDRCAWLAGHYDEHGKEAWLKSKEENREIW